MKITLKQARYISNKYDLGKVLSMKYIPSGYVNFSYDLMTQKGEYIIQILSGDFDKYKEKTMDEQFKLLNYLHKSNFPYSIPVPLKNKNKSYFVIINNRHLWVYKKIKGVIKSKMDDHDLKEIAKASAIYHKYVIGLKLGKRSDFNYGWIEKEFEKMSKIEPKNKYDILMLKNLPLYKKALDKLKNMDYGDNFIMAHADLHESNVIFDDDKIIGIIDFNNLEYSPIANDLAITLYETSLKKWKLDAENHKILIDEYQKYNKLSNKDKELIIPLIVRYYCFIFKWHYNGMKKHKDKRYQGLIDDGIAIKNLLPFLT